MALLPESPGSMSYAAGLTDFSPLGDLGNTFYKGAQNKLDYGKARAFQDGLPRDATGNIDFSKVADTLARFGDISQVVPLSNTELDRRLIDTAMRSAGMDLGLGAPGGGQPQGGAPGQPQGGPQAPRMMTPMPAGQPAAARPDIAPTGLPRAQVQPTAKVWGDKDAEDAGIYEPSTAPTPTPTPAPRPATAPQRVAQVPAPAATPAPAPAPAASGGASADPLASLLPPGVNRENVGAYLEQLRRRAAAFALSPRTAGMAKQWEDQAKVIETALQPTGGQKEAYASGGLTPIQFENAKIVAKVEAENKAMVPEQKLYRQAVEQGFKGTEMDFHAQREAIKGSNFKIIGKDRATGNDIHGFIDPANRKAYDINGKPIDTSKVIGFENGGSADLTGQAYLETLDPGRANQVKAIAEGRMSPPGGMSLKSPQIQALMRDVAQYEPDFDLTTWSARNKTRADLASGKMGQNVSSFNTAIGHLETLDKAADDLKNSLNPLWNKVANIFVTQSGDPRINAFNVAKTAVADELTRAFRGTGGNVHDLVQWETAISSAGSPQQLKAAIKQAVDLLRSRIEAVGDQYNRGMGKTTDPLELLSPKARKGIERLEGGAGHGVDDMAAEAKRRGLIK